MKLHPILVVLLCLAFVAVSTKERSKKSRKNKIELKDNEKSEDEILKIIFSSLSPTTKTTAHPLTTSKPEPPKYTTKPPKISKVTPANKRSKNALKKVPRDTAEKTKPRKNKNGKNARKFYGEKTQSSTLASLDQTPINFISTATAPVTSTTSQITTPLHITHDPLSNLEKRSDEQIEMNGKSTPKKVDPQVEEPRKAPQSGVTIVNNTQSNSNNSNYTFNNINNNNFYIFGGQLDEVLKHFPAPPPHLALPPPPLPPLLFGCQSGQYEWKLVKKQKTDVTSSDETHSGLPGEKIECDHLFKNLHELLNKTKLPSSTFSPTINESIQNENGTSANIDESSSVDDHVNTQTNTTQSSQISPSTKDDDANESTLANDFLKLRIVESKESMKSLDLPEGTIIYRKDLRVPYIKTDQWRAFVLSKCGDGRTDGEEECDDADQNNNNSCKNDCTLNVCGDGVKGPNEECDEDDFTIYDKHRCGGRGLLCSERCTVLC